MLRPTLIALSLFALSAPSLAETLKAKLDNGLTVIVREDNRAPVVMSQIWYKIGSVDEKVGKSGLSHALEHMMFKGTKEIPEGEFSRRVSAMGGDLNAYTSATETVYHENVANQHLPEILKMEADRMVNLNFNDATFRNEMKVISEERRQNVEDEPTGNMYEQMLYRAYDKPSNQTAVIGHMKDIQSLKANDLRQWYRQWYAPNNATVVIVGDVNAKETIDLVKKTFGHIPAKAMPTRQDVSEREVKAHPASAFTTGNTKQPMFTLGYRVPSLQKLDDKIPYALDMLVSILDGNSSSRFDKNLIRGKQLALSLSASYDLISRQPPLFTISGMPSEKSNLRDLKKAVEAEIADIAQNGVSEEELQRAKTIEQANTVYSRDSMSGQAFIIGTLEINGFNHDDEAELRRQIQAVTAEDVQKVAQLLTPQREVFIELYPRESKEGKAISAMRNQKAKAQQTQKNQINKKKSARSTKSLSK